MSYSGTVALIDGLIQKNNQTFPLVHANAVYVDDNTRVDEALNKRAPIASPTFTGTPKAPTAAAGTNTTQIATTAFVQQAFKQVDAMLFKGTIGSSGATVTELPSTHEQGWTYKVATDGTYAGYKCEIGDLIICVTDGTANNNAHWTVVQTNIDGAVTGPASSTNNVIAIFDGTSGKIIKNSGFTIGKSVPSDAVFTDTWNKVSTSQDGYVTKLSGNTAQFLRGDGTWQQPQAMKGATSSANGATGFVPAPVSGDSNKFLRGDGTWQPIDAGTIGDMDPITTEEINQILV